MQPARVPPQPDRRGGRHLGWLGLLIAVLTLATFAVAFTTQPRSGTLCATDCIPPPYAHAARFVPRDYLWMYPAIVVTMLIVVLVIAALAVMATLYGSDLAYRFELVAISVTWFAVVLVGGTLAVAHLGTVRPGSHERPGAAGASSAPYASTSRG